MLSLFFRCLVISLMTGTVAAVYRGILPYQEQFTWWWKFGARFEGRRDWLFKPVWGCVPCISGQLALWVYLVSCIVPRLLTETGHFRRIRWHGIHSALSGGALLFGLIFTICASIFFALTFYTHLNKKNENS